MEGEEEEEFPFLSGAGKAFSLGMGKESVTGRDGARRVLSPQSFRRKEMEDWTDRMTDSCCEGIIEGSIFV